MLCIINYFCKYVTKSVHIYLSVHTAEPPTAVIEPERQTVTQDTTATLTCSVTGLPPPSIRWSRSGGELGRNHRVQGNILRITQATAADRGLYVCLAENVAGRAQASAIVEVERECFHEYIVLNEYILDV